MTTDAYGVGVNLQDASVVINYDLAWTPDTIIQRAGRILRFWREPRRVIFYVFVGAYQEDIQGRQASLAVEQRLHKLTVRSRQAERFTEMPMIPDADVTEFPSLAPLSNAQMESMGVIEVSEIEEFTGVSTFLRHITERNQNLEYAATIPDDVSSAMLYRGRQHQLYLLMRYQKEFYWTLYDIAAKRLNSIEEDELLDLIQCDKQTPIANVDPDEIELYAQTCRQMWCKQNHIPVPDEVERICALYMKPRTEEDNVGSLLRSAPR